MRTMPSPTASRALLTAALSATIAITGAGCDDAEHSNTTTTPPTAGASNKPTRATGTAPNDTPSEDSMKIQITIGEQRFEATLTESAAAHDLVAQLPVTIHMVDHGQVEKTGPLPSPLSLDGQPDGADPDVGDLGYYAPGHDLVLYYGDQSYFPGIVILGQLDNTAAQRISQLDGPVTATVEAHSE
jgi:hypothetical protein